MTNKRPIIIWLLSGCVLIFLMVFIGGITRLTHSGLSISDYNIIRFLPPMNDAEWHKAFEIYKQHPEYQKLNFYFGLEDFKNIYFWEWLHRFIGKLIGFVFIIPFLYFLTRKKIDQYLTKKCLIILAMGGAQGFLGWFMVKSGLVDRPDVSHYRLALHLFFAFLTFAYTFWVALGLIYQTQKKISPLKKPILLGLILLFIQIIWGAFVAGLDAGFVHNHFPMMSEGQWIHDTVFLEKDGILNFFEGKSGVQFAHRTLAYFVVLVSVFLFLKSKRLNIDSTQKRGIYLIVAVTIAQFLLGVTTLILVVPIELGLVHQIGAFLLLGCYVYTYHRVSRG